MSARPDLVASFRELERVVEAQPEGITGEIARGVFAMSPRPRPRHSVAQGGLFAELRTRYGSGSQGVSPDWLFLVEPEIRSEETFSRLVPDIAGWRKSTSGWPDPDTTPISLLPEWVAEVLSGSTETYDRGPKKDAYGQMGVGGLWLVDAAQRRIETFSNVRGKMTVGAVFDSGTLERSEPFPGLSLSFDRLFL